MAIKLYASSVSNKLPNVSQFRDDRQIIQEQQLNKGLITSIDPQDLPAGALSDALNCNVRYDKTGRRLGNGLFSPAAPNASQINHLTVWGRSNGTVNVVRFAANLVHMASAGAWTAITSTTPTTYGTNDRLRSAVLNDRFFFVDNGVDYIQEINTGTNTYARLGNAPKAKYIIGFGGRIMAAHCGGDPTLIQWSGDSNYGVWDVATDISAGQLNLIDISLDYADPLAGLFATDNAAIILRERSIWLALRQASATNPYYFQLAVANNGCDCPYSAVQVPMGVCYASLRYKSIFVYYPGMQQPERIGLPIEDRLVIQIQNTSNITGSYDLQNNEYHLAIPQSSAMTVIWKYNFNTQAWAYDVVVNANTIAFFDYSSTSFTMDDLVGTMDSLNGTMDTLSTTGSATPTRLLGMTNGLILQESPNSLTDNGVPFLQRVASRTYAVPELNCVFAEIRLQVTPSKYIETTGTIYIYASKNDGSIWTLMKTCVLTNADLANPIIIKTKRPFNSRRMMWKVESSDTNYQINGIEIHYFPSGESKH